MDRRTLISGAAAMAAMRLLPATRARAHTDEMDIGFGAVRVRKMASPELERAVTMDALANFLPLFRTVPGYKGYVLGTDRTDPSVSVPLWLLENAEAEAAAIEISKGYIEGLHPELTVETLAESTGNLRVVQLTERKREELPPALHGAEFGMRIRESAPGLDHDALLVKVKESLVPGLSELPGFIAYLWIQTDVGRTAINLWETEEQRGVGDQFVADWVAANAPDSTVGDPISFSGPIDYAEITTMH